MQIRQFISPAYFGNAGVQGARPRKPRTSHGVIPPAEPSSQGEDGVGDRLLRDNMLLTVSQGQDGDSHRRSSQK
jgi:hypothetical protein